MMLFANKTNFISGRCTSFTKVSCEFNYTCLVTWRHAGRTFWCQMRFVVIPRKSMLDFSNQKSATCIYTVIFRDDCGYGHWSFLLGLCFLSPYPPYFLPPIQDFRRPHLRGKGSYFFFFYIIFSHVQAQTNFNSQNWVKTFIICIHHIKKAIYRLKHNNSLKKLVLQCNILIKINRIFQQN